MEKTKKINIEVSIPVRDYKEVRCALAENAVCPEHQCMQILKLRLEHCRKQLAENVLKGTAFTTNLREDIFYTNGGGFNKTLADKMQECLDTCVRISSYKEPKLMYQQVARYIYENPDLASVDEVTCAKIFRFATERMITL